MKSTENSGLKKGCGGVGLIWRKKINSTPIPSISSDRICGIRIKSPRSGADYITVIAVYLPCSDTGREGYSEYLVELEQVVYEHQPHNHGRLQCSPRNPGRQERCGPA